MANPSPPTFRRAAVMLAVLLSLPGCWAGRGASLVTDAPEDHGDVMVPLILRRVNVVDGRDEVDRRPTVFSRLKKGETTFAHPPLTHADRALITEELRTCFGDGERDVTVVADVTRGAQTFVNGPTGRRASAEVQLLLTFSDGASGTQMFQNAGPTAFRLDARVTSAREARALYEKVLRGAVHEAMREAAAAFSGDR